MTSEDRCTQEGRLDRIEESIKELTRAVALNRAVVFGPLPDEDGGLRKDMRSIADSLRDFRAENKFLKWGVAALILMKTPDVLPLVAQFVSHLKGLP